MLDRAHLNLPDIFAGKSSEVKSISTLSLPLGSASREFIQLSIFAVLFGMASINGLHPFALSFAAANLIYRESFIVPALFSFLGSLIDMKSAASIRYLAAMAIFFFTYSLLRKANRQNRLLLLGLGVFFSNMIPGLIYLKAHGISPYDLFLLLAESGLAYIMTFIIPGGMPWLFKEPIQPTERNICMAVIAGVILSIARKIVWLGVNLRDVLGVFAVLLMALVDGPGAGAATGIIIGVTGFSFSLSPWSTAVMAFSGLVSGSFNKLGKMGVIAGFSLGYLLYNFYVNSMGEAIISLPVLAAAFILVLLLPQKLISRMRLYFSSSHNITNLNSLKLEERARDRLYELASVLNDLGRAFKDALIKKEERILSAEYFDLVCRRVQLEVCSDCGMRRICWEKELKRTMASFYTLIKQQEGLVDRKAIPFLFKSRCGRAENIKRIVKDQSDLFKVKHQMDRIMKANQELAQLHFAKAAEMIKALAEDTCDEEYERNMGTELAEKLSQLGVSVERIYTDYSDGRIVANIVKSPCTNNKHCDLLIPLAASDVLGRKISTKIIDCPLKSGSSNCRLKVVTKGPLQVSVGVAGVAKEGQTVSGDGFTFMELENGRFLLALCDGMGVGKAAAKHSEKTLAILERLLEAGFSQETAVKVTNAAMIATNPDESFSTIDAALIDTAAGKIRFIKAGAPTSFIKHRSKIEIIRGGSLPVGIMDEVVPKVTEKTIGPGDMVIMVTDGVVDAFSDKQNGEEVIRKILSEMKTTNPQDIAEGLLKKAKGQKSIRDDMTVLVGSIWEKR